MMIVCLSKSTQPTDSRTRPANRANNGRVANTVGRMAVTPRGGEDMAPFPPPLTRSKRGGQAFSDRGGPFTCQRLASLKQSGDNQHKVGRTVTVQGG